MRERVNTQSEYKGTDEEFSFYLEFARRNHYIAEQVLENVVGGGAEVGFHIARGWYGIACFVASKKKEKLPTQDEFTHLILESDMDFPDEIDRERWEDDLNWFHSFSTVPTQEDSSELFSDYAHLANHCQFLGQVIHILSKHVRVAVRKDELPKLVGSTKLGMGLLAVVVLGVVIFVGSGLFKSRTPSWKGAYYMSLDPVGDVHTTALQNRIDFDAKELKKITKDPSDIFSVRWETCLELDDHTIIEFQLGSDDGSRLFVNGEQILDLWERSGYRLRSTVKQLSPGMNLLRVDYFQDGGDGRITFKTRFPEQKEFSDIPTKMLRLPGERLTPEDDPCKEAVEE
jgi:hypothetical protein